MSYWQQFFICSLIVLAAAAAVCIPRMLPDAPELQEVEGDSGLTYQIDLLIIDGKKFLYISNGFSAGVIPLSDVNGRVPRENMRGN
jgi:hypothetical protein